MTQNQTLTQITYAIYKHNQEKGIIEPEWKMLNEIRETMHRYMHKHKENVQVVRTVERLYSKIIDVEISLTEPTEQEVLTDLNNIIFNVCDHNAVASNHYDNLVEEYHRNGEKAAYALLNEMVLNEQLFIND